MLNHCYATYINLTHVSHSAMSFYIGINGMAVPTL